MSWKSETRRKVEDALDRYAAGAVGNENLAGELEGAAQIAVDVYSLADYVTELGAYAKHISGYMLAVQIDRDHIRGMRDELLAESWVGVSSAEDAGEAVGRCRFVLDVIAAREIERGLLG